MTDLTDMNTETKSNAPSGFRTVGFAGLGLIGGTIARAIRKFYPKTRIIAYDPDRRSLEEAVGDGVVSTAAYMIGGIFRECEIIFLCAPVQRNDENLLRLKPYLSPDTVLTDVGSVKTDIHEHVRQEGLTAQFIGGHPMTGSERIGYRNSRAEFLENAYYILTPEKDFPTGKAFFMRDYIRSLGAIPLKLTCEEHDYVTGAISHLPHVISASLVNLVQQSDNKDGIMKMIAAGGFKDITRISSSSPTMWQQICLTNKENILQLIDRYDDVLHHIREEIEDSDKDHIYDFFNSARVYRESFAEAHSGPIRQEYRIHVNIADRPGVLAEVVTILAINQINIKNIGIIHNREYAEGVLNVELPDEESRKKAIHLLTDRGYQIY